MGTSDGPPWTHTFQHPALVPLLRDGLPMLDADGDPVMVAPLLPSYTITRAPEFTGVLGYLEDHQ